MSPHKKILILPEIVCEFMDKNSYKIGKNISDCNIFNEKKYEKGVSCSPDKPFTNKTLSLRHPQQIWSPDVLVRSNIYIVSNFSVWILKKCLKVISSDRQKIHSRYSLWMILLIKRSVIDNLKNNIFFTVLYECNLCQLDMQKSKTARAV